MHPNSQKCFLLHFELIWWRGGGMGCCKVVFDMSNVGGNWGNATYIKCDFMTLLYKYK